MSERAMEGPRRLTLEVPSYNQSYATGTFPDAPGWTNEGLTNAIMFESFLDLSAYELDDLTLIPTGTELQDPGKYVYDVAPAPVGAPINYPVVDVEVLDIISMERLTLTQIDAQLIDGNVPGMIGTLEDFTQVIMGNYRVMVVSNTSANAEILMPVTGGTFGSGEASAASKLWCYRVVRINGVKAVTDRIKIPASRFLLIGTVLKEPDLSYMMRLKRSYELGQD